MKRIAFIALLLFCWVLPASASAAGPRERIVIPMKFTGTPRIIEQRYVFHDVRNNVVGEIEAPYLSSK